MRTIDLKKDFPLLQHTMHGCPIRFCDNASTTQKPQAVLDALLHFYTHENANIARGLYELAEFATERYEQARTAVAEFINARTPAEIIFTKGCTESINAVAQAWAAVHCKAGDEIVITQLEHHANWLPWQHIAQKHGIQLRVIPVYPDGTLDMDAAQKIITERTKLVATTWISNAIGTYVPITTVLHYARAVGARVLIDAAQAVAHQKIDVQALKPDFLAFSGHKLCSPTGIGVLYIAQELHESMEPYQFGGGMVYTVSSPSLWLPAPHKFEAGTPPIAQAVGLAAAVSYFKKHIDFISLQKHEAALCAQLIEALQKDPKVQLYGPLDQLKKMGHIVSFTIEDMHAHDVAAYLAQFGICVRAGHHCAQPLARALYYDATIRVSFFAYNTTEDVDAIISALAQLKK
jgi:cysteine desulfurase/selenocysteine lyase